MRYKYLFLKARLEKEEQLVHTHADCMRGPLGHWGVIVATPTSGWQAGRCAQPQQEQNSRFVLCERGWMGFDRKLKWTLIPPNLLSLSLLPSVYFLSLLWISSVSVILPLLPPFFLPNSPNTIPMLSTHFLLCSLLSASWFLSCLDPFSGLGRLLFRGQHGGQHSVCLGKCQPVFGVPAGGPDEHQRLQCAARWRSCRVHQEPPAQEPG